MSARLRIGPASISSRGRVGLNVGPVGIYGGGRRRRSSGGGGGALGALLVIGIAVVLAVKYWYVVAPLALLIIVLGIATARRNAVRREEAAVAAAEAHQQWLAGPPPPLTVPSRFTDKWFASYVPTLHPGQIPVLLDELRRRGWGDDQIALRVQPYIAQNPNAR